MTMSWGSSCLKPSSSYFCDGDVQLLDLAHSPSNLFHTQTDLCSTVSTGRPKKIKKKGQNSSGTLSFWSVLPSFGNVMQIAQFANPDLFC